MIIHDEDVYLLEEQYRLPHLRSLIVNSHQNHRYPGISVDSKGSTKILEDLMIVYGGTLKTLDVTGIWNINMTGTKFYPVQALETLKLTRKNIYKAAFINLLNFIMAVMAGLH